MAELLHYLDKMEYRPTPKTKHKVLLKRRPEPEETTTAEDTSKLAIDILDKRSESGFKRLLIKDFERIIGTVQEKKDRKEGEPRRPDVGIYIEPFQDVVDELELPHTSSQKPDVESKEEPEKSEEKEPVTPAELSKLLDERMEDLEEEEPKTPEDVSKQLDERMKELEEEESEGEEEPVTKKSKPVEAPKKRQRKGEKEKEKEKEDLTMPKMQINASTKIDGEPVLDRIPKQPSLDKLVVRAPSYYMANRKLYLQHISKLFMKFSKELLDDKTPVSCDRQGTTKDMDLLIHQRIVREYLNIYSPYRGLLLYHGLGSGKTCTSIAIAEAAKTHKRVFVMTPASLKMNFFSELKKCGDSLYRKNQHWDFISVEGRPEYVSILSQILSIKPEFIMKNGGAWLVDIRKVESNYADLSPENQKSLDEQLNEMIRAKYVDINYNGLTKARFDTIVKEYGKNNPSKNPFDHSVVLVDEAHNLVSRIVNNIANKDSISAKLYEYLQSAQDVRIVFMSGTPIINYPNEMGVLFNMLRGYIKTWKFTIPTTAGAKLSTDKILKMFHKEDFKTFDYIDYSNDVLSITRNPFGFINVDSSNKKGTSEKPVLPKTTINGGVKLSGTIPEDSDSDDDDESIEEIVEKKKNPNAKRVTPKRKSHKHSSSRKTAKKTLPSDEDEYMVETAPYKLNKGAIELPEDKPVDLSDDIKAQIEREIHQTRNAVGEDEYHSGGSGMEVYWGGAIVVDDNYSGVRLDEQGNLSDTAFENRIKEILTKNDIAFSPKIEVESYKSLPDKKKDFFDMFIDIDTLKVQRPDVLKKRILGLTSYFRSAQESLLPKFILSDNTINPQFHIEYVEMSDHQFIDYSKERMTEIKREPKKKKTGAEANKEALKVSGTYRTFTRAKCNFSFPNEIPRPSPPGFNPEKDVAANVLDNINDDNELDMEDANEDASLKSISGDYEKSIAKALKELKESANIYLTPTGLKQYSPKFAKILENVKDEQNRGLHLIYSAFRTLEGVGVLKLVLEANGFAEFKLKKTGANWTIAESDNPEDAKKPKFVLYTGTETAEEKEIIRNVYNSNWSFVPSTIADKLRETSENNYYGEAIKIIMITSSGAEGINLENTRFVHIVEPYWHMVRIDQVVGRARRICSHKNLPEELRTIKVFLYMSKFSDKQRFSGENVGIMNRDTSRLKDAPKGAKVGETSITTDETLFEIAVIKDRLTKQLLKSVKESSVDCSVYDNSKEGVVCYTYGFSKTNEFGSFPSYADDRYVREGTDVEKRVVKIDKLVIDKVAYAHNTETGELYDFNEYKNNKNTKLVGNVGYNAKGKPMLMK
jgi:hypothetical protein